MKQIAKATSTMAIFIQGLIRSFLKLNISRTSLNMNLKFHTNNLSRSTIPKIKEIGKEIERKMKNVVSRQKSFLRLHFVRFDLDLLHASRCNAFFFVYEILRSYLTAFFIYSSFKYVKIEVNFRDFSHCLFFT